ncbi:hypothetical protein KIN20_026176 [Parelaphostrongylus tenuis]|uniref:Uncharacterized protein n=1 Tax=Parelaphostrongylus tenuis TaxID=148309 RepID=A0AAD5N9L0_PARTN|nr:hypothetical protein KIN20_026176 [Parelaphostrongylus tenuis]
MDKLIQAAVRALFNLRGKDLESPVTCWEPLPRLKRRPRKAAKTSKMRKEGSTLYSERTTEYGNSSMSLSTYGQCCDGETTDLNLPIDSTAYDYCSEAEAVDISMNYLGDNECSQVSSTNSSISSLTSDQFLQLGATDFSGNSPQYQSPDSENNDYSINSLLHEYSPADKYTGIDSSYKEELSNHGSIERSLEQNPRYEEQPPERADAASPLRSAAVRALFNLRGKDLDRPVTCWEPPRRKRRPRKAAKTSKMRKEGSTLYSERTTEYGNSSMSLSTYGQCCDGDTIDLNLPIDSTAYDYCSEAEAVDISMNYLGDNECSQVSSTNSSIGSLTSDQFLQLGATDFSGNSPQYQSPDSENNDYSINSLLHEYSPADKYTGIDSSYKEELSNHGSIERSLEQNPRYEEQPPERADAASPLRSAAVRALFNLRGKDLDRPVTCWEPPRRKRRPRKAAKTSKMRKEGSTLYSERTTEYGNSSMSLSTYGQCCDGDTIDLNLPIDSTAYDYCSEAEAVDISMNYLGDNECSQVSSTNSSIGSLTSDQFLQLGATDFSGNSPQYQSPDSENNDYSINSLLHEYSPADKYTGIDSSYKEELSNHGSIERSLEQNPRYEEQPPERADAASPLRSAAVRALFNLRGKDLDRPVTCWEPPRRKRRPRKAAKTSKMRKEGSTLYSERTTEYGNSSMSLSTYGQCCDGDTIDLNLPIDSTAYDYCSEAEAVDISMNYLGDNECSQVSSTNSSIGSLTSDQFLQLGATDFSGNSPQYQSPDSENNDYSINSLLHEYSPADKYTGIDSSYKEELSNHGSIERSLEQNPRYEEQPPERADAASPLRSAAVRALFNLRGKDLDRPVTCWEPPRRKRRPRKAAKTSKMRKEGSTLYSERTTEYGNSSMSLSTYGQCCDGDTIDLNLPIDSTAYDYCSEAEAVDISMNYLGDNECSQVSSTNSSIGSLTSDQFLQLGATDFSGNSPQYQSPDSENNDYSINSLLHEYSPADKYTGIDSSYKEELSNHGSIERSLEQNPRYEEQPPERADAARPLRSAAIRALLKIRDLASNTSTACWEPPRRRRRRHRKSHQNPCCCVFVPYVNLKGFFDKKKADGMHHICIEVDNITKAMEACKSKRIRTLAEKPKVGAHGKESSNRL